MTQLGEGIRFNDWEDFFEYVCKKTENKPFVVVLDEFQRLLDTSPDCITKLQRFWDEKLKNTSAIIFLVGSSIGLMQQIVESRAGPLYGRVTGRIKIAPFRYIDFRELFPQLNEEEKTAVYSVFGGTPHYCVMFQNKQLNLHDAISELVLAKGSELEDEPEHFLEYERVRAHAKYNAILQAIAAGKGTLKELSDTTKISPTTLPAYLLRLEKLLDIVARRNPILGKERLSRYVIRDPFFAFWYRFVLPNRTSLHFGNRQQALDDIKENLNAHTALVFEDVVKKLLILHNGKAIKGVSIRFDYIGSWWDRMTNEIDIIATNQKEKSLLVGEIKWTNEKIDIDVPENLLQKIKYLQFNGTYKVFLVSKSGFTARCLERIKSIDGFTLDLSEMTTLFDKL